MVYNKKYTAPVNSRLQTRMKQLLLSNKYTRPKASKVVARELSGRFKRYYTHHGVLQQWDQLNRNAKPSEKVVFDFTSKKFKKGSSRNITRNRPTKINLDKMVEETVQEVKQPKTSVQVLEGVKPKNIVIHTNKDGVSIHINLD